MNAMRAPPWPMRGVSSRSFTPFAFSSASAPSMSSTSKQMWNRPSPFSVIHWVDAGFRGRAFQQFDIGLADRQHGEAGRSDLLLVFQRNAEGVAQHIQSTG